MSLYVCDKKEEDLEAQISFLQGQINDLEAMSKYCAKMMNTHICEFIKWSSGCDHFHYIKSFFKIAICGWLCDCCVSDCLTCFHR